LVFWLTLKELGGLNEAEVAAEQHELVQGEHIVFVEDAVEGWVATSRVRLLAVVLKDYFHAAADRHFRVERPAELTGLAVRLLFDVARRQLCQLLLDVVEHRHQNLLVNFRKRAII